MVVLRRVKRLLGGWPPTSDHWSQIDATGTIVTAAGTLEIEGERCTNQACYFWNENNAGPKCLQQVRIMGHRIIIFRHGDCKHSVKFPIDKYR